MSTTRPRERGVAGARLSGTPRSVRITLLAVGFLYGVLGYVDATSRGLVPTAYALLVLGAYSWAYLIAGAIAWERRSDSRVAALLTAVGVAGPSVFFAGSSIPVLDQAPWIGVPLMNVFLVWLILSYPSGRLRSPVYPLLIGAIGLTLAATNVLVSAVGQQVLSYSSLFLLALAASLLVLVAQRWLQASQAARRNLSPMLLAGILVALVYAAESLSFLLTIPAGPDTPLRWATLIARAAVPVAVLIGLLNQRIARGAVAELVLGLDASKMGHLRESLARALGDPSLQVGLWSAESATYRDADGSAVEIPADDEERGVILLERDGERLGAIVHDAAVADDPGLVSGVKAAIAMAVDIERLNAAILSQLDEVRASRARIVEAADAERRRVERNLHDGAQQRLVALSLALRRARAQVPGDAGSDLDATLAEASEQLASALAELRDLARGIHPAILTEAGLGPALRSLARESAVPVAVNIDIGGSLPDPVAAAAYFVAAEGLANVAKYAGADRVSLRAAAVDGHLRLEIADDGVGGADPASGSGLRGLIDRVSALGGLLEIESPPGGGTRLVADLPLASLEAE